MLLLQEIALVQGSSAGIAACTCLQGVHRSDVKAPIPAKVTLHRRSTYVGDWLSGERGPRWESKPRCRTLKLPMASGSEKKLSSTAEKVVQETESTQLARRWREVHGANGWKGLLDPMDKDLREEVIRYGEFSQACYDAFDNDTYSKYCGSCRYAKQRLLEKVGLPDTGYEVTKYLFATTDIKLGFNLKNQANDAWSTSSNWIGFIAVATDEKVIKEMGRRDIVIAWRGTVTKLEWTANLAFSLKPSALDARNTSSKRWLTLRLEEGFLSLYTTKNVNTRYNKRSAREQVLSEVKRLLKLYEGEELSITVTGHSLGAALALICAYDLAESGVNQHSDNASVPEQWNELTTATPTSSPATAKDGLIPVTVFSFAGPRVGNTAFADRVDELGVKVLRVVNVHDFVPRVPGLILNEDLRAINNLFDSFPWTYSHVGVELQVDHLLSPYLRPNASASDIHNLEAYLHLIAGYQSPGNPFSFGTRRDIALVNKASNFLVSHKYIPQQWWQLENKGLIRNEDGVWIQMERDVRDIPSTEN